jgi:hypothetical protein
VRYLQSSTRTGESLEEHLLRSGCGDLYENILKPFLRGVFLTEISNIDAHYGKGIITSFLHGDSGLPRAGAGVLAEALAARVENIHLNSKVDSLTQFDGKDIIVATDSVTADSLLGIHTEITWANSFTYYHSIAAEAIQSTQLRVTSARSLIVNSIALSNTIEDYAPAGKTLIATTTLEHVDSATLKSEMGKFWGISGFEEIAEYEIRNSLPIFAPGAQQLAQSSKIAENVFRAGDYLSAGSQNAALLSGRLSATELLEQRER